MSPELPRTVSDAEPKSGRSPAPITIIILFTLLFYFGLVYLNNNAGGFNSMVYGPYSSFADLDRAQPPPTDGPDLKRGKILYDANCFACHQATGLGTPGQCPPLAGSDWVANPSPHRIIRLVLNGGTGPITVSGKPYNYTMTPFKSTALTDKDFADILSFVRMNKEWGNSAPAVTAKQVADIRKKLEGNNAMFSADQLMKIQEGE
jgi:mono/diheme cytochrome c family protein